MGPRRFLGSQLKPLFPARPTVLAVQRHPAKYEADHLAEKLDIFAIQVGQELGQVRQEFLRKRVQFCLIFLRMQHALQPDLLIVFYRQQSPVLIP